MTFGGYYAGKRVLVTGHTGFKGSWMTAWLQELGAEVIGLSLPEPPSEPSHFVVADMADSMVSLKGDVRDGATVEAAIEEHRPQVVFHLAAQALVRAAYASPADTFATNVVGTANVLESVHRIGGTEAVVMITSDKCYENNEWVWGYRETDALGGHDPYSASKGAAELVIRTFQDERFQGQAQHRCAIASTRAGNVIGGGDWAVDRLVPDVVASIAAGRDIVIRSPHATRPWQHVLEPLSGYLHLGERLATTGGFRSAYNFGPEMVGGEAVAEIVEALLERWNDSGTRLVIEPDESGRESGLLRLDCSRAKNELGWRPIWPLPVALDHIADWYRTYYRDSNADMAAVTRAQIATYEEDAAAGGVDWATA